MTKPVKITYIFFGLAVLSSFLHNAIYGIFKIEEPVFFMLALILFLAFIGSIIYNLITYFAKGKPKDIWKLAFLGLIGLIGLIPNFGPGFYGFFGFFGFFGARKNRLI